ncbi:MAG: protein kinase domain-containing protein [Planctomycetota bacterium]|jgi:hypothetical protein
MTPPSDERERAAQAPTERRDEGDGGRLPPGVPRRIGHYAIQSVIASGGMGTVYKAVQEKPRRAVAIKIMKASVASASALRRFEYETQLLGRLRHPGIAQIYEAGTFEDGADTLPFFAMEYIPNAKEITAYAREKKLGTRERLELFAKACDAVHHGHQKGIVHRDLKPSNILVGPAGDPKIIDFGVARATDSDLALTVMQTNVGQLLGTVQYMSPEQCEADPDDIDIRSDVYALGVALFELLCGRLPYAIDDAPIHEATRMIREDAPARPSTIDTRLRGDVETIVLKALEKERDRRYQSARGLARDVRAYLAGEAIHARPASMAYQLRVFARRNKAMVGGLAVVVAVLVVSAVAVTAVSFRAANDRLRAEQERLRAEAESLRAERESERAEAEREKLADAQQYLWGIVGSVNPSKGEAINVSDLLDDYSRKIEQRFAEQPLLEAQVRSTLAINYVYLNLIHDTGRAEEHFGAAIAHLERAVEIRRRELGDGHDETLESFEMLAGFLAYGGNDARAERVRRLSLELSASENGPEHPLTHRARGNLAGMLLAIGRLAEAEDLRREVYESRLRQHGEEHAGTLSALGRLAQVRQERGDLAEAEEMCRRRLEGARRIFEPGEKDLNNAVSGLANVYVARGKIVDARALYGLSVDPGELGVEWWYGSVPGPTDISFNDPTLLVFWETWCPFSQLWVPRIQTLSSDYEEGALQVLGLVGQTNGSTRAQVQGFIDRNNLLFPNAKSDRQLTRRISQTGVPAAMALHDGGVVWMGHPAYVSRTFLEGLAGADAN